MAIILLYQESIIVLVALEVECLEIVRVNQQDEAYGKYV